ncbi:MAG TPA: class A beta-lactamase [Pseudonocardia sp.]|nr:class A beta-lactamase [Pseudonocardia sp.]
MTGRLTRRTLLAGCLGALPLVAVSCAGAAGPPGAPPSPGLSPAPAPSGAGPAVAEAGRALADLETRFGGRLGVFALDTGSGAAIGHRADERFPLCSTFKVLAAAAILRLRGERPGLLDQLVHYTPAQVIDGSPVSGPRAADGMTVSALCRAAIDHSDNTAANLLLGILGGPPAVTAFASTLGDPLTRLDRTEPELNVVPPGELRDTSTPALMAADLRALVLGDALDPAGRELLTGWLVGITTGGTRIRAGLPAGWRVGDKTGNGSRGEANDLAVAWPPGRAPLIISGYSVPADPAAQPNNRVLADAAAIVTKALVPAA